MQEIDLETWHRKEHFNFFKNVAYPVYNICFDVDVTALKAYTHKYALSFHLAMMFQTTAALNELENFRYRLRGEQIILHDTLTPSFANISPDTDLFKMVTVDMTMDMHTFVNQAAAKSRHKQLIL